MADQQVKSKIFQALNCIVTNLPLNAIRIEDDHMVSRKRRFDISSHLSFQTGSMGNISLIWRLAAQALALGIIEKPSGGYNS